ncbi:MAG TPA: helix-turn-helix transcriptional regulator [Bdellovibrionota bacterium]|nr:helix-turn-helix transcriptional regulator [Bdellovibrionota bacterium]
MNPVRKLRHHTGFTQARLAKLGGTSQPTIAAYESGGKSVTLRTLEHLATVSGLEIDICYVPPMTREERRSVSLHRSIARKLAAEPEVVLRKAKCVLDRMIAKHPSASPLLFEWRFLISLPVAELIEVLTDIRPHSRELRQLTPFAGVLSARERASIYRSFEIASEGKRK